MISNNYLRPFESYPLHLWQSKPLEWMASIKTLQFRRRHNTFILQHLNKHGLKSFQYILQMNGPYFPFLWRSSKGSFLDTLSPTGWLSPENGHSIVMVIQSFTRYCAWSGSRTDQVLGQCPPSLNRQGFQWFHCCRSMHYVYGKVRTNFWSFSSPYLGAVPVWWINSVNLIWFCCCAWDPYFSWEPVLFCLLSILVQFFDAGHWWTLYYHQVIPLIVFAI